MARRSLATNYDQDDLVAGFLVGGLRDEVPCLDRDAFDLVAEGRALFAGLTAADVGALELLKSRAVSESGALATCDAAAGASDVGAGGAGCALPGSDDGGGFGGPDADDGESAAAFPRCAIASTTR